MKLTDLKVGDIVKLDLEMWDKGYEVTKKDANTVWLADPRNGQEYPYRQLDGWLLKKGNEFVELKRKRKKVKKSNNYRRIVL
jgi:frataxin-like iron-binding protein CyaY